MFAHCYQANVMREEAAVAVAETVSLRGAGAQYNTGGVIVIRTSGWTVGTLTVAVVGGDDGEATSAYTPLGTDLGRTISGNGITYIPLDGCFPIGLAVVLTPGGGFDGDVSVDFRTATLTSVNV